MQVVSWCVAALLAVAVAAPARAAAPPMQPNTKRYHVTADQFATGRAGNATVAARMLINKDGTADLEATTGDLDSPMTPPGNLSMLQFKLFDGNGNVVWTKPYTNLSSGGYFRSQFTEIRRGMPFQVQANVRGIDGPRTSVVTVSGNAKLRPDLEVQLSSSANGTAGVPVTFLATVREINGDTGATANCVLYVESASPPSRSRQTTTTRPTTLPMPRSISAAAASGMLIATCTVGPRWVHIMVRDTIEPQSVPTRRHRIGRAI